MKLILSLFLLLALAFGGLLLLAHHDTTARADVAYAKRAPVAASFSRVRGDKEHLVSVYWRLRFAGKSQPSTAVVAFWSLRPFRHVTLVAK